MKRLLASLFMAAGLCAAAYSAETPPAPAPDIPEGFTKVKTVGGFTEYTLDSNGLQVLLMPDYSSPTLTFMVTYRVGSRNEVTGTTGATHLLEHLMFKGTEKFNRAKHTGIDQILEKIGGQYNATTWRDRTNYYENIGNENLPIAVEMEADRMRGLLLREEDRQPEMTVVRNEFERRENSPTGALGNEIYAAAYIAHPYHHPTIGWRSDIEKVSIEKLREFYNVFYWPDNATVSIIGSFQPAEALALVKKFYGAIPKAPHPIPQVYTIEPEQTGPRRVTVKRAGQLNVIGIGHKTPAGTDPDFAAVAVASAILTDGKNSRLYKALTDKNLTVNVNGSLSLSHDPAMHIIYATVAPNVDPAVVEKTALDEIEKLKHEGVTEAEVQAAIAKNRADSAFQRDGSFAVAGNLNEFIAAGDWTLFYTLDEATEKVTPADVQRVANKYFNADQSTTGWFIPIKRGPAPKPLTK